MSGHVKCQTLTGIAGKFNHLHIYRWTHLPYHSLRNPWIKGQQPKHKNKLILKLETNVWCQKRRHNTKKPKENNHEF